LTLTAQTEQHLTDWLGDGWTAQPIVGDASVRAYYRIFTPRGTYILAWYPPQLHEQLTRFVAAWRALRDLAPVPAVLEYSDEAVLQEDAGELSLFQMLHEERARGVALYGEAIEILARLQKSPDPGILPPFTAAYFFNELEMAREFFVEKLVEHDGGRLVPFAHAICDTIAGHPYRLCHRDFHGHNVYVKGDHLFVIDYQDLRMGPDTYDLASLLRDRGVARVLRREDELRLVDQWAAAAGAAGDYRRRYFEVLLQRSIKILGTFAKQPIVRGLTNYLRYIPPTLESIHRCIDDLPEFEPLRDIFPLSFDLAVAEERARELHRQFA
jgi:aminoglycoside/choline kinase family phosphotransferase